MTKDGVHGEDVLQSGAWGKIVALRLPDGTKPAREFLTGLSGTDQAGLKARMVRLAETGNQKTPENFRRLEVDGHPPVYELKHTARNLRLYLIKGNRRFYATHGRRKPRDRQVAREVQRAREIWKESGGDG